MIEGCFLARREQMALSKLSLVLYSFVGLRVQCRT